MRLCFSKMASMSEESDNKRGWMLSVLLLSALGLLFAAWAWLEHISSVNLPQGEYAVLAQGEALPLDIELQALAQREESWMPVTLPFHWRNRFADTRAVWYRLRLPLSALSNLHGVTADTVWGFYVWRLNQTADVWLNGQKIGSGGNTGEPMARYWNSPLYFEFPASQLRPQNEILIKHYSQHGWGSMEPVVLASSAVLTPLYASRSFVQHDVAQGLFVFVLVTGLFSFTVWFYRRREIEYLWFAVASAALSVYCLNQFLRYLPVGADTWRWVTNVSVDLWAYALLIFILRSLQVRKPRVEKMALFYLLFGVALYFYASFYQAFDINIYYHLGSLLLGVYVFFVCLALYRQEHKILPLFYCCAIALMFVAGVHDTVMQAVLNNGWLGGAEPEFQNHFNSLHFAAPVIFMFLGASLIKRFIASMNAADSLNAQLETRIAQARLELEENYRAIEEVLIRQSASEERERIYRDLHDDVGSKLLSLYYRLEKESDSILAKSALEDLRDIVSRKSLESCVLHNAVQQWHQETSERVADAGVMLIWNADAVKEEHMLSELQYTQLRRMLREVLSNALLHSRGITQIQVRMDVTSGTLGISVANDGAPKPVSAWRSGRGISNLRVRTRDLGGEFSLVDREGSWVEVTWRVPLGSGEGEGVGADTHS